MASTAGTIGAIAAAAAIPAIIGLIDKKTKGKPRRYYERGSEIYNRAGEIAGSAQGFNTELKTYDYWGRAGTGGDFEFDALDGWSDPIILTNVNLGPNGYQDWTVTTDGQGACNGNSIKIRRHTVRFSFTPNSNILLADGVTTKVRLLMWTDREKLEGANISQPTVDLFQSVTPSSGRSLTTPLQVTNFGRFQIFHDSIFQLDTAQSGQIEDAHHNYFKSHELHALWADSNQHNANSSLHGHIYAAVFFTNITTDSSGNETYDSSANPPGFQLYSRIRYVDN